MLALFSPVFVPVTLRQLGVRVKFPLDSQVETADALARFGFDGFMVFAGGGRVFELELEDPLSAVEEAQGLVNWTQIMAGS